MPRVTQALRRPAGEHPLEQLVRYGVVGATGYALAMGLYAGELALGMPPYPAIVIVFVANGIINFVLLRIWAFPPTGRRPSSELMRFGVVAAGSLGVNYGTFAIVYSELGVPAVPAQAIAIAVAAPLGFLANRIWSFRGS